MGPREASGRSGFGGAILGPLWLIFPTKDRKGAPGSPEAGPGSIGRRRCPQECQHQRQGGYAGCDGKTRQGDAGDDGPPRFGFRAAGGILGGEVDDQAHHRHRLVGHPADAEPADFEQPGQLSAGRTSRRPAWASTRARSSATSRAKGRAPCAAAFRRSQASRDLPDPGGPRISTALGPTSTAEAWMVDGLAGPSHRRQAHDEAGAEHARLFASRAGRSAVLGADACRHALRRSAWRSTGRARSSGRSPARGRSV